ncbi:hypothetical protein KKH43_06670 [Patescibacteria group bacterium]|nr:hypothetical protein [Patescibacteria group bacterium]
MTPTGESAERMHAVAEQEKKKQEVTIGPEELTELISKKGESVDLKGMSQSDPDRYQQLITALTNRSVKSELPLDTQAFSGNDLRSYDVYMLDVIQQKEAARALFFGTVNDETLQDASAFLAEELPKAEWLEQNKYPELYGAATTSARAEIKQLFIEHGIEEGFPSADKPEIVLKDQLTFLLNESNDPEEYSHVEGDTITLRVTERMTEDDEWDVYLTSVHELLTSIGEHSAKETGEELTDEQVRARETVVNIVTRMVATKHVEKGKTPLSGEEEFEYHPLQYLIFTNIPEKKFAEALVSTDALQELMDEFQEKYSKNEQIVGYAKHLKGLIAAQSEEFPEEKEGEEALADVISIADYLEKKKQERKE